MQEKELLKFIEKAAKDGVTTLNLSWKRKFLTWLPPEIGQLTKLTTLNLRHNELLTLPPEIGQLTKLTKLDLSDNQLSTLPPEIGQLTKLTTLDLHQNRLSTLPPEIGQLTELTTLYLSQNQLSTLPPEIGQLTKLTTLYLGSNQLSTLPPQIGQLTKLTELGLSHNQLSTLPPEIGQVTKLTTLYLSRNQLSTLPPEIGQLTKLTTLNLRSNQLSTLPPEIGQLSQLTKVDVSYNQLPTLPPQIGQLTKLTTLDLGSNQLSTLPPQIGQLTKLTRLNLYRNQLSMLPPEIGQLTKLATLELWNNQLSTLPPEIGQLTKLTTLNLRKNQLSMLAPEIGQLTKLTWLNLGNNSLPIPPEILADTRKPAAIVEYYLREKKPLNEAKIAVVGPERVGKTALLKRLIEDRFDEEHKRTEGIEIKRWGVSVDDVEIKLNVWEFGGYEIMYNTHELFMSKRTLYLLVLDATVEDNHSQLDYWLKFIQCVGADSPIVVVSNKIDQHQFVLNQHELQEKYPTIKAFVHISCKTGQGIAEFERQIAAMIGELEHVHAEIPVGWMGIKTNLYKSDQSYLTHSQYVRLCQAKNINGEAEQRLLIRLLHDLGVVLSFQDDPRLTESRVLNPEWVAGAIYKIINSELVAQNKGVLKIEQLDQILDSDNYPRQKHWLIIDLMRKFELCFDLEGHTDEKFLIPDLLPVQQPKLDWPADSLYSEYRPDFWPQSEISRFIVRISDFIFEETYWRNGVVLVNNQNRALVKVAQDGKKISIFVIGQAQYKENLLIDIHDALSYSKDVLYIKYIILYSIAPVKKLIKNNYEINKNNTFLHPAKSYRDALRRGEYHYQQAEYTQARQVLVEGYQSMQLLRGMIQKQEAQVELSAKSVKLHQMLVKSCLVEERERKAFEYATVGKGRAFVNTLAKGRFDFLAIQVHNPAFATQLAEARQIRQEIDDLANQSSHVREQSNKQELGSLSYLFLSDESRRRREVAIDDLENHSSVREENDQEELRDQQHLLRRKELKLWREMAEQYPALTAMLTVPTLSAKQAYDLAEELHATLVEYYRHAEGWCAFVIRKDADEKKAVRYVPLPGVTNDLLDKMLEWRNELHLPAGKSSFRNRRLERLYEVAIAPLGLNDSDERVVIAPFDQLHLVPLSTAYNRETKRYLAQEHTLSFVPSLTALYVVNQERTRRPRSEKSIQRLLSVAYPGPPDNYLPNVLEEGEAIVQRLPKVAAKTAKGIVVERLHGDEATPDKVIEQAPDYDMIHFGCHGGFNSEQPEESGLRLAGENENAYLTVQRIITELNLKQTRLATLAACLTGEVKLQEGEEHVGLLQAIMTAGAETVVASLWHVDDAATRTLFEAFYFTEVQFHSPAQAMIEASELVRQQEKWSHPYYWAAFHVNGLTSPAKDNQKVEWPAELLKHIEQDNERSIPRGISMNHKLIMDNAEVLLKTMVEFYDDILPALEKYPLSEELAELQVEINELNVAKALHYIVEDNRDLRDKFPNADVGEIRINKRQNKATAGGKPTDKDAGKIINHVSASKIQAELVSTLKAEYKPNPPRASRRTLLTYLTDLLKGRS